MTAAEALRADETRKDNTETAEPVGRSESAGDMILEWDTDLEEAIGYRAVPAECPVTDPHAIARSTPGRSRDIRTRSREACRMRLMTSRRSAACAAA